TFVDPSVEFGLRFETQDEDEDTTPAEVEEAPMEEMVEPEEADTDTPKEADVVSLDQFRK
ncbi:MAG: hypothetical protein AAFQ00_11290, partial [Pseudomonadota bacterium]